MLTTLFQSAVVTRRPEAPQPDDEQRPSVVADEKPALEISRMQLVDVLSEHRVWVESGGKAGERADLTNNFLPGVDLSGVSLRDAFLRKAGLAGADLSFADLRDACLVHASLDRANLLHTKLRGAGLQGASLEGASGLLPEQLGAASLFGAVLPKPIVEALFERTKSAAGVSRMVRHLFVAMLAASVCAAGLVITTTDLQIIENAPVLPLAGRVMPVEGFYMLAPMLLLGLYVAFHVVLLGLWEKMAELPAVYPDGQPLDRKGRWMFMGLVRSRFRWLDEDRLAVSPLQKILLMVPAYWVVPATLVLFWGRYLTRLDMHASTYHAGLVTAAIVLATVLPVSAEVIFRSRKGKEGHRAGRVIAIRASFGVCVGILLFLLSLGIVHGAPHEERRVGRTHGATEKWAAQILWLAGYDPFARFSESEISKRPAGWSNQEKDLALVRGPRLDGRRMRHADAFAVFLVNARLSGANLQEANLVAADLRGAVLRQSNLQFAVLDRAQMSSADLHGAQLSKASLVSADLRGANLAYAALVEATLMGTHLDGATLFAASLRGATLHAAVLHKADLRESDLTGADMNGASLPDAQLWGAVLANAQLRDANLQGAMLAEADLRGADLRGARLQGAHLMRAQLDGANLENAELAGVSGMTLEQLCSAKNWRKAQMSDEFRQQAENHCKLNP